MLCPALVPGESDIKEGGGKERGGRARMRKPGGGGRLDSQRCQTSEVKEGAEPPSSFPL